MTDSESIQRSLQSRIVPGLFVLTALLVAFQPVASDDLHWQLSRGREVFRGSMEPSRDLLSLEDQSESDWLGGVLPFAAWWLGGPYGLAAIRVLIVGVTAWLMWRRSRDGRHVLPFLMAGLVLLSPAFDPSPLLFDVLFMGVAWHVATAARDWSPPSRTLRLLVVFLLWANVAPRVLLGVIMVLLGAGSTALRADSASDSWRVTAKAVLKTVFLSAGAAILGACCTPRGVWGLADSARFVMPCVFVPREFLAGTNWAPLIVTESGRIIALVVLLSLAAAAKLIRQGLNLFDVFAFAACQLFLWNWTFNVAPMTVWLIFVIAARRAASSILERGAVDQSGGVSGGVSYSGFVSCAVVIAVASALWVDRGRFVPGFGLHERLDDRLVRAVVKDGEPGETALAVGNRAAGVVAWLDRGLLVQDIPERALVAGRLTGLRQLESDLRRARRNSFRRGDGSKGGWWRPLVDRHTRLILLPAADTELIAALEPTIWKPLLYDAPVLAFVRADDGTYLGNLLQILREREIMNRGRWHFDPPAGTGSEFDRDWFGLRESRWRTRRSLQLARVLRAMKLPVAALRVLHSIRHTRPVPETGDSVMVELHRCHLDLAWQERLAAGRCTPYRLALLKATGNVDEELANRLGLGLEARDFSRSARQYVEGNLQEVISALDGFNRGGPLFRGPGRFAYDIFMLRLEDGEMVSRAEVTETLRTLGARGVFADEELPDVRILLLHLRDTAIQ